MAWILRVIAAVMFVLVAMYPNDMKIVLEWTIKFMTISGLLFLIYYTLKYDR